MANSRDKEPEKPRRQPNAVASYLGNLSQGDLPADVQDYMRRLREDLQTYRAQMGIAPATDKGAEEADQARALQPDIVGDEPSAEAKGRPSKSRPGKTLTHGADLVVRYYKVTEAQLDRLGETNRDVTKAYSFAAFLFALGLDLIRDVLISTNMSGAQKGVWFTAAAFCLFFSVQYGWRGFKKERSGKTQLQAIKDKQDFTTAK